ncbi:TrmH family RNA methyltransferase [Leptolyngbya sp. AN02str]|uniref:TrmH family RNA methyltransferase n=1 Tax=Leptolyngbya sp. AN02str TaxID=3423363 RepID=UPI003D31F489
MNLVLTSVQNPLVKQLRKLQRAKERREQGLFLLEGTHLLEEAIALHYPLATVCCTESWRDRYPKLWIKVGQQAQRVELVSEPVLEAIATTVHPDGVIATAPRRPQPSIPQPLKLGLALETIQDPGNLGTMIRTAAAVGVDGLWVSDDSVDLDHPKVLRATAGQWFRMPMVNTAQLSADLRTLQAQGVQVVSTRMNAALTYWDVDFAKPTLVVLGNEGSGLSAEASAIADVSVRIPLEPGVESLNVAIAAALILYEAKRQQR